MTNVLNTEVLDRLQRNSHDACYVDKQYYYNLHKLVISYSYAGMIVHQTNNNILINHRHLC